MSLSLLPSCLSPKIAFSLRTAPAPSIPEAISRFDSLLYDSLSNIVGSFLSAWSWDKASLPVSLGGIGLKCASHYASAAYIGSVCQSSSIVESILGPSLSGPDLSSSFQTCLHSVGGLTGPPFRMWIVPSNVFSPMPSTPSTLNPSFLPHQIIDPGPFSCPPPYHMLVLGCRQFPLPHLVYYSLISSFGSVSSIVPLYSKDSAFLVCSTPADIFGDHQVSCGGNRDRIHRHDALRDIISTFASSALGPHKEVPSLIPGRSSCPADIFLPNWQHLSSPVPHSGHCCLGPGTCHHLHGD